MAIAFLMTVDTEADDEWFLDGRQYRNIVQELPSFQDLCDRRGVKPTYLVTCDALRCDAARETLVRLGQGGGAEFGSHLHAWTTPPQHELPHAEEYHSPYLHEYPVDIQEHKLAHQTQLVTEALGQPTAYRGGRWDLDRTAVELLAKYGYVVDSSVTPGVSWQPNPGCSPGSVGPDFTSESTTPYLLCADGPGLLEVPISIVSRGLTKGVRGPKALASLWRRVLERTGLGRTVWLRPDFSSYAQMRWVCDELHRHGAPVLNLALRSSDLYSAGTPRSQDPEAVQRLRSSVEQVVSYVTGELGATPMTLSEYAAQRVSTDVTS